MRKLFLPRAKVFHLRELALSDTEAAISLICKEIKAYNESVSPEYRIPRPLELATEWVQMRRKERWDNRLEILEM
jgi:hypothetical protein